MTKTVSTTPERMLSRGSLADRWEVSRETVKRREKAGLIKAYHFNARLLRYKLSEIMEYEAAAAGGAK